jgi:cytochrome c oxidase cbb3-type subunit 3
MADLPLLWQIVVTGLIILGLVYLLTLGISIYFSKESDVHDVSWDGNLEEGPNPAPAWWFWLGISSAIFAIFYMIFYPSFGNYKGLFEMDNAQRYIESKAEIKRDYYKELEGLEQSDTVTLQFNADAMKLASNIFAQNCSTCHNKDGIGQDPNTIAKIRCTKNWITLQGNAMTSNTKLTIFFFSNRMLFLIINIISNTFNILCNTINALFA